MRRSTTSPGVLLALLSVLTSASSRALTAREAAEAVLEQGQVALGAVTGSVVVPAPGTGELELVGTVGALSPWSDLPLDALGRAVGAARPLVLDGADLAGWPLTGSVRSLLLLPLSFDGRAVGVLTFGFDRADRFDGPLEQFGLALADLLAQTLERVRLLDAAQRTRERLTVLLEVNRTLSASLDDAVPLESVVGLCVRSLADWALLDVWDEDDSARRVGAHRDPGQAEHVRALTRWPARTGPFGPAAQVERGEPLCLNGVPDGWLTGAAPDGAPLPTVRALGARSVLIAPLRSGTRVLGAVTLVRSQDPRPFEEDDETLAMDIGLRIATAVGHARAHGALTRERARLSAVLEHTLAVGYLKDRDGRYLYVNAAFEALFDLSRHDVIGRTDVELFGEGVGGALRANDVAVLAGDAPGDFEERADTPRGPVVYRSIKFPLPDVDGVPEGIGGLSVDVTELKRAEERQRAWNEELERQVRARTAELRAANEALESFSYSVSHDLRTPVRHMMSFTGLLRRQLAAASGGEVGGRTEQLLTTIEGSARRMNALIDALLELARTDRQAPRITDVDLGEVVRAARESVTAASGAAVTWSVGALPTVRGDEALLRQVFENLLSNAVKYSARVAAPQVEVSAEPEGAFWVIRVRDNGAGFDVRYASKLFGVFQRLHREDEFEGTGVGLATVRRIVERHGGSVRAEGEVGRGASFFVRLPRGGSDGGAA